MTLAAYFSTGAAGVVDTGGKFAAGGNLSPGIINDTGGNLTISDCLHFKVNLKGKI
jgi:hypothetical protein